MLNGTHLVMLAARTGHDSAVETTMLVEETPTTSPDVDLTPVPHASSSSCNEPGIKFIAKTLINNKLNIIINM